MNEVVALHRQAVPNDSRTDSQISLLYGDANPALLQQYPQFAQDYQTLAAQRKEDMAPSIGQEFSTGVSRGVYGLEATAEGALGLGAGVVGADSLKNYFLQKAQANQEDAAANPPSVENLSDAKSFSDYAHYFAGSVGELVPNVAEAAVTSAAGAAVGGAVGTSVGPEGTVAGGAGGFLAGLFEKQAIKSLIRKGVISGLEDLGTAEGKSLLTKETTNLGLKYGTEIANTINFWGQSAGSTYNTLTQNKNVDPTTAINVAIFGGLAQSLPAQFLPSYITKKFFGDAAPEVNSYFARLVSEAAKVIPGGAAAMDLQELASIASEKYADPATRAQAFDLSSWGKPDVQRLVKATATGALAGLVGSPIAAIPGGKPAEEVKGYTGDQSAKDLQDMTAIAQRDLAGSLTIDDKAKIRTFDPEQKNAYTLVKGKLGQEPASQNTAKPADVPGWQSRDIESGVQPDASDLAAVTARLKTDPAPTVAHPELSDDDILKALAPKPPESAADQPAAPPPVQSGSAAPVAPVAPAAPSPALAAARSASVAALDPEAQETRARVADAATQATVTPPTHATPTVEKPRVVIGGIPIAMENPEGSTRTGKSGDWQVKMPAHYGEIIGSKGADGDPLDVYIGPKPEGEKVFVVDQVNPDTKAFDEHKIMLGFETKAEAQAAYMAAFSDGKGAARIGGITETTKSGLRHWLEHGDHTKRFGESVENTGTTGIPGQNQDEPKVNEKVLDRAGKIGSENIDFDNSNIVAQESAAGKNRGKAGAGETTKFEPSYFDIKPGELEDHKALGERLVSGARSSDQKRAYQDSRRVTAVQDNQTGKVFLLGTYKEKTDGSVKLADPDKVGQRNSNTRLGDILAQKTEDGKQRYTPFASMRLNEVKRSFVQEYASRAAFDKDIGEDARQRMGTMADHAQSIEELHDAGLKERGINLPGDSTDEEHEDETPETAAPEAKSEEGFTAAHADALWNVFGGEEEPLTRERFEELFSSDLPKSRSAVAALKVAVLHEMDANKLSPIDALEIVKNKLYGSLEEGDRSGKGAFKESAIQSLGPEATEQPGGGRDETAKALEASIRQRATEQQSKGAEGNAVVNNPSVLKFRTPGQRLGEAFSRWFGKSQMVDKDGKPKVYFHGTSSDVESFDNSKLNPRALYGPGHYFTDNPRVAGGDDATKGYSLKGHVNKDDLYDEHSVLDGETWEQAEKRVKSELLSAGEDPDDFTLLRTTHKENGRRYIDSYAYAEGNPNVIPAYLKIEHPFDIGDINEDWEKVLNKVEKLRPDFNFDESYDRLHASLDNVTNEQVYQAIRHGIDENGHTLGKAETNKVLQQLGYDGIIHEGGQRRGDVLHNVAIAFDPKQIKSAIGNRGTFDPSDPRINFRKPEGVAEVTEQHSALLDSIHKAAVDGGMNVQRIGQDLSGLSDEFAKNTGASYDRASRTVAQVVGDVIGREDVVTSFHEVGHDLFARLPEHLQQRVLSAIDKLSDRQAGVDISSDPRIRAANPTGMSAGALAEERLVEATALHLTDEGFSPQASKGYAQAFVRGLKDLYLRAAMSVQRALFGDDFTNPLLAQRFFENRMKQFLAGDFTRTSFLDMLGGGKPSQAKSASWHATGATLFERIGSDGKVEYGHTPDTSLDASRLNNLVFRKPEMPAEDQKTAIEIRSALFNHQLEMFGKAAQSPEILTAARESEQTGDTYLLKTLRLADPMAMKTELENGLAEAKSGIQYDHTKTIDQFKDASNSDRAARDAYVNAQALQSKVSARKSQAVETYSDLADKREKVLQKYEEQKANYADWQGSTTEATWAMRQEGNKLFASISGESKKLGGIEQQLKAIDPNADIKKYAPAFQRLFTGEQLKGERLFNVLDKLANDPKIDFTQPINKIRDALSADPAYADFVQDTNESRALTATIVAFAKTHSQVMANLELRRAASGEERVGIVKRLDDLKSEKTNFLTNLRDLARNAKLEDRVRQSYRNALLDVRSINRRMDNAKAQIAAADALSPVISKEQARLAEKLAIGTTTTFGDGAEYAVPLTKGASTAELMKPRAAGIEFQHPIGWQINKLVLDTTDRTKLSNPEVVEQHLRQMAEFLNEREARFDAGDLGAKDTAYQGVKNAFEEIAANKNFNLKVAPSERFLAELRVLGEGQKVEDAFGTPTARAIGQMVRHETDEIQRMHPQAERIWRRNEQLEDELIKLLPGKMADKRNTLRSDFLNPAKKTMQGQRELAEIHAGNPTALKSAIYNRVMDKLLSSKATAQYVKGNEAKWRAGLQNLLEFQHDANKYFESQARGEGDRAMTVFGRQVATGHGVADERLKAANPATGKVETATRKPIPVGPYTFAQKMSQGFKNMVNALRNSGWIANDENGQARSLAADDFGKIAEAYNKGDHKQVATLTQKYFNHPQYGDAVRNNFFRSLAEMDTESPFQAPTKADAITSFPADIAKVQEAYQRAGDDPIAFFELLHQLHGGEGDAGQYIQSQMLRLADLAKESHSIMEKIEPTGTDRDVSVRGMTSDYALNASRIDHLPGEWFDYHSFDAADSYAITKRIAAQNAYGPGGERLGNAFDSLKNEVTQAQYKLRQAQEEVRRANPDQKTMTKLVTAKVGGEAEYKRLTQFNKRSSLIAESVKALSSYHRRDNTPDGTLNFFVRAAHAIGSLMINQPSSAISLLTQLTDVNLRYGASRSVIGASLRGVASAGKEIAGSLAQAVGLSIFNGGEFANRYREMGFNDPASIRKFTDSFGRLDHEGRGAHFFRIAQDALGTPVNRLGDKATHVPFRPLQPFDTVGSVVDQKITEMVWQLASQHLSRGQEFYRNNLDKLNDPKFKLTPESLGLKGASKDSFERFTGDMTRWNLNYDDMVRNGMQRGDKTLFTNQEAARLYSMAVSEIALRGNLANFSAAWNNNSLLRIAAPLMAWSFRRMVQVGSLRLNAEGQNNMAAFARGVAGLSLAAGGGVAVSAMLDQYYQKLVGKERNLRPIIGAPDLQQAGLGLMEDLSRVGTFGMFGELANSIIGSGQSGDNRALSVDQRVLAISSLQSVLQAADNWVNQGYNVDYSHVVRPLMGAMGGGALIQYMQLANNALGLDNVEARVTARINAQNYLRVVGRELGMEVKSEVGGSGTPTEITPYFTAMELAAYKNSAGDFREAYNNAVMAAKKLGQEDPVEYVKRSFATRNPLKQVFQTVPSQYDYERLLANMPGSGNQDVSQAVRLFNQYGAMIGIKPFDGKVEKPQPIAKVMSDYRQRSALALQ